MIGNVKNRYAFMLVYTDSNTAALFNTTCLSQPPFSTHLYGAVMAYDILEEYTNK